MASPAVTYTFTNGTTADATQINTNFTDLINALTDGTKSISIDALTVAGAALFNGAVTLGNATGDDITVTGYVASNVIPKTTDTYALGSTSLLYSVLYATKILAGDGTAAAPAYSFNSSGSSDNGMYLSGANEVSFATAGTQRVVIQADGDVGIGGAPDYAFHVKTDGRVAISSVSGTSNSYVNFRTGTTGAVGIESSTGGGLLTGSAAYSLVLTSTGAYPVQIGTSDTVRVTVKSTGEVGIGTTNPSRPLHVYSTQIVTARLDNAHATTPNGIYQEFTAAAPDNNTQYFMNCVDNAATRNVIYSDGDVWTSDAGTLTSDERLKTNIQPATQKLKDILNLKVRNFEWKEEYHPNKVGEKKIGFIAQEFEEVFPKLVSEHTFKLQGEEVTRKSIRYGALIPILTKAIQEQNALIVALTGRLDKLEAR